MAESTDGTLTPTAAAAPLPRHLGIVGGGQLGRMAAMAARDLGLRVRVLDPNPDCCAAAVADAHLRAGLDDVAAATELSRACEVVTCEIEKVPPPVLHALARHAALRPRPAVLEVVQDRARQKIFVQAQGCAVGRFAVVERPADAVAALTAWAQDGAPVPARLKTCRGGYDGRGQAVLGGAAPAAGVAAAWEHLGGVPCVLEEELALRAELSVLVARRPGGQVAVYPPARNLHRRGILHVSQLPALDADGYVAQAQAWAVRLAERLELVGLLAVEFFVTEAGVLLVNELAPRPHNSYHASTLCCATGQFEQLVRAICDLPLGACTVQRPAALCNLLGELWEGERTPPFAAALQDPEVRLVLYDKAPRPGRKMGHLLAGGSSPAAAQARVLRAYASLRPETA